MKRLYSLFSIILVLFLFIACEEDYEKVTINNEVQQNTLTDLSADSYALTFEQGSETFESFSWTAPDYGFEAAITYTLQVAVSETSFENPVNLVTTEDVSSSLTVSEINETLLGMGLEPDVSGNVEFRVRSTVNPNIDPVYSNVVSANVTPYEVTFPPIYIIGDAQDWDLGAALEVTSTGPGTYEAIGQFENGGKFRMFATPSWDAEQWGYSFFDGGSIATDLADGMDGDSNFIFEGATGVYKITINLNNQTITMEESELPTLFVIGDGQSWDLQQAAELVYMGGGKFQGTAVLQQDGYFRLFEQADWGATQYGYGYFAEGTLPDEFAEAGDGDDNFIFTGATSEYEVLVDLDDLEVTIEAIAQYPPALYLVGDDQEWTFGNSPTFTDMGNGVFEANDVTFTNGSTFRFFEEIDNWSDAYGFGYFTGGVDELLESVGDSDDNLRFIGADGTFIVTVDFENNTVELE